MDTLRKTLRRYEDGRARFVTFSTYRRLPLLANNAIKDRFASHLAHVRAQTGLRLFAWVVMPDHVHLVFLPGEQSGSTVLNGLKSPFAREVLARWRELEAPILDRVTDDAGRQRFWQRGGGYDRNIRDKDELVEKIRYVDENPVRRGLVVRPAQWAWSSARWHQGDHSGPVPIDPIPW
ncbi:MAG: transposase [Phycisphaerales bacterium JB054]